MLYTENPIPEDLPLPQRLMIDGHREDLKNDTFMRRGALHFKSSNAVVPLHFFKIAYCTPPAAQEAAYDAELERTVNDYVGKFRGDSKLAKALAG